MAFADRIRALYNANDLALVAGVAISELLQKMCNLQLFVLSLSF
jgi:hypothetical protein